MEPVDIVRQCETVGLNPEYEMMKALWECALQLSLIRRHLEDNQQQVSTRLSAERVRDPDHGNVVG